MMSAERMNEREFAIELFNKIDNSAFQDALRNKCYKEIISLAPPQAVEIVLGLPDIPPRWARDLLKFCNLPLTRKQIAALVESVTRDSWQAYLLFEFGIQYKLSRKQVAALAAIVTSNAYYACLLLEFGSSYKLSRKQVADLVESVKQNSWLSCMLLENSSGYPLSRKQVAALEASANSK